ncbi:GGDEF domain-containing protein [Sphingomicrobium arenosum]|uniref:GGDEF domain-containing protein n=1 Tax=Sphingomicrobium arenosum TaxID=2233861 RepID=UPI00223F7C00|nr:GGDEF domain-containing protein [Sphingomicrobium arenosum]
MILRALGALKINVAALALAAAVAISVHYGPALGLAIVARVAALLTIYLLGVRLRRAVEDDGEYRVELARWSRSAALAGFSWSLLLWAVPPDEIGSLGAQGLFSIVLLGVASAINTIIGERRAILYFSIPFGLSAAAYFIALAPVAGWLPLLIAALGFVIIILFAINIDKQQQHLASIFAENVMLAQSLHRANVELSDALTIADRLAHYDPLTGLRNRRSFEQESRRLQRDRAAGDRHDVMLLDVDHFKSLNDRFGHAHGDTVLRRVGKAIQLFARVHDDALVARIGGEEFVLILSGAASDEEAVTRAENLRERIEHLSQEGSGRQGAVSASIGTTRWSAGEALQVALGRADRLLYAAKEAGRNRTCDDYGMAGCRR